MKLTPRQENSPGMWRLFINAVMSVAQVIVTGGVYFILYRYLIDEIGVEQLGIWSAVLATLSVGRISNLGLASSVVKYVSKHAATNDSSMVVQIIETAGLTMAAFSGLMVAVLVFAARPILGLISDDPVIIEAGMSLVPYALVSLWLSMIAGVYQSGLDGFQRIDQRSLLLMASAVVYLTASFLFVENYGLIGLAYAQLVQTIFVFCAAWLLLRRLVKGVSIIPFRWSKPAFREMLTYALNMQLITAVSLVLEPVAKGMVGRFGGMSALGYFEMANRLVLQIRQLLNAAGQALVPTVAHLQETDETQIDALYTRAYRAMFFLVIPALCLTLVSIPAISELWVGFYEPSFVIFASILTVGLFLGMLSSPAFFVFMGIGILRYNTIAQISMLVVTAAFGMLFGPTHGPVAIVVTYAIAFIIGGSIILVGFHTGRGLGLKSMIPQENLPLLLSALLAGAASLYTWHEYRPAMGVWWAAIATISLCSILLVVPFWRHPMRHEITSWLVNRLNRKEKSHA